MIKNGHIYFWYETPFSLKKSSYLQKRFFVVFSESRDKIGYINFCPEMLPFIQKKGFHDFLRKYCL